MISYLSLGSNKGKKLENIKKALYYISSDNQLTILKKSSLYETEPIDIKSKSLFINLVIKIKTSLKPFKLLEELEKIEQKLGRKYKGQNKSRVIDIDILTYGKKNIKTKKLTLPHKKMHEREFVIVPLNEIKGKKYEHTKNIKKI